MERSVPAGPGLAGQGGRPALYLRIYLPTTPAITRSEPVSGRRLCPRRRSGRRRVPGSGAGGGARGTVPAPRPTAEFETSQRRSSDRTPPRTPSSLLRSYHRTTEWEQALRAAGPAPLQPRPSAPPAPSPDQGCPGTAPHTGPSNGPARGPAPAPTGVDRTAHPMAPQGDPHQHRTVHRSTYNKPGKPMG